MFASYGVLCWIADVDAWMSSAHAALRPGGRLVLIDLHPASQMVGGVDPLEFDFPYLGAAPMRFEASGSYAAPDADTSANTSVEYAHGLGEIVTAAVTSGLRVDALTEWLDEIVRPTWRHPRGRRRRPLPVATGRRLPSAADLLAPRDQGLRPAQPGPQAPHRPRCSSRAPRCAAVNRST